MSFALPWIFALGVGTAVGVVALHLLSTRRPPERPLPTARFVPESDLRAVSRTSRPTDLPLLALRVLAVLAIAAAFAQPVPDAPGPTLRRVVALEWTSALADVEAARGRAQALLGVGDALVVFDTAARVVDAAALATLEAPTVRGAALSPMLVAVRDAAATIARGADSLAVTVLSAVPAEAWDDATMALRATWPGRLAIERLDATVDAEAPSVVRVLPADADDPIVAAAAMLTDARGAAAPAGDTRATNAPRRIRRGAMLAEDSLWLAQTPGGVLLSWPRDADAALRADGVFASLGGSAALVAPLGRRALDVGDDSGVAGAEAAAAAGARVIARWRDGVPAATERGLGQGCLRDIGLYVPERGDVTLREPFAQLLAVLLEPCGGRRSAAPSDSLLVAFAGDGPLAAAALFERDGQGSPLVPWLLAAALLMLIAEQWWRRRATSEATR
ncbi:MAG TPA: BatA domain-containing protein [Gemmatimonadaceae bacterium]|nr:BatA domain-containing protein [Gemmatimonadaceae bacterium]